MLLLVIISCLTACKSTSPIISSRKGYKYGGITKDGFDCSGLMYTVFNSENIVLPRNSFEQSKIGVVLNQKREQVQKGDLIFFKTNKNKQINHVGIVIEVTGEEIKFIHSSTSKGVIISSTKEAYYKNTLVQINRIL